MRFGLLGEARSDLICGLAVAATALFLYAGSLWNGFVWDDDIVILGNPLLKGGVLDLFAGIDAGRSGDLTPYYRPLTLLSFLVEGRLHGFNPYLVRLVNVLLHAANSFLVYRLARTLFTGLVPSLLAGLLFAVHPVASEGVNFNAGGRNTMLACLFVISSYLCHRRGVIQGRVSWSLAGALLFLAGLLSKESTMALLPFIVALELPLSRGGEPTKWWRAAARLAPYAAGTLLYGVLRTMALRGAGVRVDIFSGLGERLAQNLYVIPRYLLTVVWPPAQSSRYVIPEDLHLHLLPLITGWLFLAVVFWWVLIRNRSRATLFGAGWLAAFWLPVSGIVPIPSAAMADRYLYLPAIGIWLAVADQVVRALPERPATRRCAVIAAAVILLDLASLTVRRSAVWKSDVALFSRLTEQFPDDAYGHHNLGCAYLDKEKNLYLAERQFTRALALDPLFPRLRTQLGYVSLLRGDLEGALQHYTAAVQINPGDAEAHLNRGIVLERLGRAAEALGEFRSFLALPSTELPGARPLAEESVRRLSGFLNRGTSH